MGSDVGSWKLFIGALAVTLLLSFLIHAILQGVPHSNTTQTNLSVFTNLTLYFVSGNIQNTVGVNLIFWSFTLPIKLVYDFVTPNVIKDYLVSDVMAFSYLPNEAQSIIGILLFASFALSIYTFVVMLIP